MNPIEKIKEGLVNGNLQEIAEGYKMMTGEEIKISVAGQETLEQIKRLVDEFFKDKPSTLQSNTFFPESVIKEPTKKDGEYVIVQTQGGEKVINPAPIPTLPMCFMCNEREVENEYASLCKECLRAKLAGKDVDPKELPVDTDDE